MSNFTVKWHGKEVTQELHSAAVKGLKDAAEFLLDESNKIAPIDEGTLIASGETSVDAQKLQSAVSYDTPYAVVQHEDMSLSHKNGRQSKFLETAYKNNIKRIRDYLARSIKL